jgi:hypothetical protein
MTVTLSAGPVLAAEERGVHIIFVPDNAVPCGSPGNPTENELKEVAKFIGFPAPTDIIVFGGKPYHFADGKLKRIDIDGGSVRTLANAPRGTPGHA